MHIIYFELARLKKKITEMTAQLLYDKDFLKSLLEHNFLANYK